MSSKVSLPSSTANLFLLLKFMSSKVLLPSCAANLFLLLSLFIYRNTISVLSPFHIKDSGKTKISEAYDYFVFKY